MDLFENNLNKFNINTPPVQKFEMDEKLPLESFVLCMADAHIGEVVNKEEMLEMNEYNLEVFERRLNYLIRKMLRIKELQKNNFDELVIFFLGDMFSGNIHQELMVMNETNIVNCHLGAVNIFSQVINFLLNYFSKIKIKAIIGNHTRMTGKPHYKEKYVNWDYLFYKTLQLVFRNEDRVEFEIPKSPFLLTEIKGNKFLAMHGDNIRSWLGIPWYGIEKMVAKLMEMLSSMKKYFDYILLGHFHTGATLDKSKGERMICGSMIGGNEYAMNRFYASSRPRQTIFGVHKTNGITWRYPINLDNVTKNENINFKFKYD